MEPLTRQHLIPLWQVSDVDSIWTFLPDDKPDSEASFIQYASPLTLEGKPERQLAFATCLRGNPPTIVGTSSYLDIDPRNRSLEIGRTWITPAWQRTFVNTEAKRLMLRHAFEDLGMVRVFLKTHSENKQSRQAILRLGATFEGIFRKHTLLPDGTWRDTAYYSILDTEWPTIKARLEDQLNRQ